MRNCCCPLYYKNRSFNLLTGFACFIEKKSKMKNTLFPLIFFYCLPFAFGQKTYTNPIDPELNLSDPFVLQHEGTYYLYASTDLQEGFRAWRSKDLVDWDPVGWVFQKSEASWGQGAFWAPEVIAYRGKFYMVYSSRGKTMFGNGMRICIAEADSPEGPFQELHAPLFDLGSGTIDGHIYIEDGQPYLYYEMVGAVGNHAQDKGFLWGVIM